jgi:hypothetical protein
MCEAVVFKQSAYLSEGKFLTRRRGVQGEEGEFRRRVLRVNEIFCS